MGLYDSYVGGPVRKTGRQLTQKGKDKRFLNWQRKREVMGYNYPTASGAIETTASPIDYALGGGLIRTIGKSIAMAPTVAEAGTIPLYKALGEVGSELGSGMLEGAPAAFTGVLGSSAGLTLGGKFGPGFFEDDEESKSGGLINYRFNPYK